MPAPETQFAVLMFTDIVGSTELKLRHGVPAYQAALRIHNDHFERVVRSCRGVKILQNVGDGYVARADSVVEAVKAALLFQHAMRDEPWGALQFSSRVGIDAGETVSFETERGSGMVAPALDVASRVMALAQGGQILMTHQAFEARRFLSEHPEVVGKAFPPLRWQSHGFYQLKGREEPVEICEVALAGDAPLVAPPDGVKARRTALAGGSEAGTGTSSTRVATPPRGLRHLRTFCLVALVLAAAFALKLAVEETRWGVRADRWLAFQVQLGMSALGSSHKDKVLLLDISGIQPEPVDDPLRSPPIVATPRARLVEIIKAVAEMHPRSIAVDIDFSAFKDGRPVTPGDPAFFQKILDISTSNKVPIFLGVSRQQWQGPASWLGEADFRPLAAGVKVPEEPETRDYYVRWQRAPDGTWALPNFGLALAGHAAEAGQLKPSRFAWAARAAHLRSVVPSVPEAVGGEMSWARIDYSQLDTLESEFLSVVHVEALSDNGRKIPGRMILIGDVSQPQGADKFNLVLRPRPLAGIYLHACAALTAAGSPVLELTRPGRLAIYLPVALLAAYLAALPRAWRSGWRRLLSIVVAILAPYVLAVLLGLGSRVLWTDFLALTLGLLFYLAGLHREDRAATN